MRDRRTRPCDHCGQASNLCFRVQWQPDQRWQLLCPDCQAQVSRGNPLYRYGGTWKGRSPRRSAQ